jgi:hypothetical protein
MLWVAAGILLAACNATSHVSLPPEPASPRTVLLAYLDALVAGDCATARALATSGLVAYPGGIWCDSPRVIGYTAPAPSDQPGGDPTAELVYRIEINVVEGDISLPDGWRVWFFDLKHQPDGTWRVSSTGSGP